ncbi:MAG: hypothetical protein ACRYFV_00155 [Janthinobacterium lividum]
MSHFASLVYWVDALLDIITDETNLAGGDFLIDFERLLHLLAGHVPTIRGSYGESPPA